MKHPIMNGDYDVIQKKLQMKILILTVCVLRLAGFVSPIGQVQDMSVEELLNNLRIENYTGKPIDINLEDVGIDTIFSRLEKFSGLSFELSPNIHMHSLAKKAFSFKQIPWDRILSVVLREFSLEAIPTEGGLYVQPKEDNMVRIIREDQLKATESSRIPPFLYFLAALMLTGGVIGFLLYTKRLKASKTTSEGFVINPDKADEIMKRVMYLFEVENIYRKEDISLQSLSEGLSIPSYQLSWIINKKMNVTFSRLVNSYRVEDVKKRLASYQEADKTILDIAFDAGFNTKTSFNRVFKKLTRMTPSQYRRRYKVPD
jgi:AraC-like DNA-binding protein